MSDCRPVVAAVVVVMTAVAEGSSHWQIQGTGSYAG